MWERHEDVNAKWKHFLIAPEVRWWPGDEMYTGHFFGLDAIYTHYNVGAVKFPLGMYKEVRRHRLQGDFYGIGLFYGYSWWLGSRIRLEAEAGLAVGKADGEKFECVHCGTKIGEYSDVALVPKLGLNLAFGTRPNYRHGGKGMGETIYQVDTLVTPPALFLVRLQELPQTQSAGDSLSRRHPYVMPMHKYRPLTELPAPGRDSMLYVHFPYDRTELIYDFDGNAPVLDTIVSITRLLKADEAVGSTYLSIVGLASIEGRQRHNIELSEGRARAVERAIKAGETRSTGSGRASAGSEAGFTVLTTSSARMVGGRKTLFPVSVFVDVGESGTIGTIVRVSETTTASVLTDSVVWADAETDAMMIHSPARMRRSFMARRSYLMLTLLISKWMPVFRMSSCGQRRQSFTLEKRLAALSTPRTKIWHLTGT